MRASRLAMMVAVLVSFVPLAWCQIEEDSIWTLVTSDGLTTTWGDVPEIGSVEDSVLNAVMYPGDTVIVTVWMVAHQDVLSNPRLYMVITPSAGFPTTDAQLVYAAGGGSAPYPSSPERLYFEWSGVPAGMPSHGMWSSSSVYDVFPEYGAGKASSFTITDEAPPWGFDPLGQSYDADVLAPCAAAEPAAYAQVELTFMAQAGIELGKYYMHIDSYGIDGLGEYNPFSHDATIVINVLPLAPFAGFAAMGSCCGLLFWRRFEA